jgi:hypothetical protein
MSWVAGKGLLVKNSNFINTGKQNLSSGIRLLNPPAYGIDIEPSAGASCQNGIFSKILMQGNLGGNLVMSGDNTAQSKNIVFDSSVFKATVKAKNNLNAFLAGSVLSCTFKNCFFYGTVDCEYNFRQGADIEPTSLTKNVFTNCVFSDIYIENNKEFTANLFHDGLFFTNNFYFVEVSNSTFISKQAGILHVKSTNTNFNEQNSPVFKNNKLWSISSLKQSESEWLGVKNDKFMLINATVSNNAIYYTDAKPAESQGARALPVFQKNKFSKLTSIEMKKEFSRIKILLSK